jgi:hypothetical protein
MSWLPLAFLGFGLLFVVLGARTVFRDRHRRSEWLPAPGRVVASRLSGDDGQLQCQVAYRREGREVLFWNPFSSTTMGDPVGREVEVLVNPDDPADAVVSRGLAGGSITGYVFIAFGLFAVAFGAYQLR